MTADPSTSLRAGLKAYPALENETKGLLSEITEAGTR